MLFAYRSLCGLIVKWIGGTVFLGERIGHGKDPEDPETMWLRPRV